jgi:NADH-quinone oxidoreductase subunit J
MNPGIGTEQAIVTEIIFWILVLCTVVSAIAVVQIKDLFRASLFLIVTFLGIAGMFILLRAEFLAGVQLMIYVGAISVLIIFAILMTKDIDEGNPSHGFRLPVAIISLIFMGIAIYVVSKTEWPLLISQSLTTAQISQIQTVFENTIPSTAQMLLRDFVLAFEAVSVLLLAAVLGALALVRER